MARAAGARLRPPLHVYASCCTCTGVRSRIACARHSSLLATHACASGLHILCALRMQAAEAAIKEAAEEAAKAAKMAAEAASAALKAANVASAATAAQKASAEKSAAEKDKQ